MHRIMDYPDKYSRLCDFPLTKLEEEYDYETDSEQIYTAKKHMLTESIMAIEFYIKEDPVLLVQNLNGQ